jgi:hypothetical protein
MVRAYLNKLTAREWVHPCDAANTLCRDGDWDRFIDNSNLASKAIPKVDSTVRAASSISATTPLTL